MKLKLPHSMTKPVSFLSLCVLALSLSTPLSAVTIYVSDTIGAPMRSGASNAHRIVSLAVAAGTRLEVLEVDEDAGFTQVRTQRGTEGWIRSQYLTPTPVASERLRQANAKLKANEISLAQLREQLGEVSNERSTSQTDASGLRAQLSARESELAEIKRISAGAINMDAENRKLTTLNERLRSEVSSLVDEKNLIQDNIEQKWLLIGAGLVMGGMFLGVFIKARPRRSGWS